MLVLNSKGTLGCGRETDTSKTSCYFYIRIYMKQGVCVCVHIERLCLMLDGWFLLTGKLFACCGVEFTIKWSILI